MMKKMSLFENGDISTSSLNGYQPKLFSYSSFNKTSPRKSGSAHSTPRNKGNDNLFLNKNPYRSSSTPTSPLNKSTINSSVKPIDGNKYFGLLKKNDVVEHLTKMNDDLHFAEAELRETKNENSKLDSLRKETQTDLQILERKYMNLQKVFLDHLEGITRLCLQEEAIKLGHPTEAAINYAYEKAESRVQDDLHKAFKEQELFSGTSLEHFAMSTVAKSRVEQLKKSCSLYRIELAKAEIKNLDADRVSSMKVKVAYTDSLESDLKQLGKEKASVDDKLFLQKRMNLQAQSEIDDLKQQLEESERSKIRLRRSYIMQSDAVEQFTEELKSEVKKRYGFVPASLEYYIKQNNPVASSEYSSSRSKRAW